MEHFANPKMLMQYLGEKKKLLVKLLHNFIAKILKKLVFFSNIYTGFSLIGSSPVGCGPVVMLVNIINMIDCNSNDFV